MLHKYSLFSLIGAIAVILSVEANSASIRVSPTQVNLGADGKAAAVTIRNLSDKPTSIQAMTKLWEGDDDQVGLVNEILVVPPIFDIPAGGAQTIRLAAKGLEAVAKEKAYILLFKEVPDFTQVDGSGLAFVLNVELPLFVTPRSAEPDAVWALRRSPEGNASLSLTNAGNAHLRVDEFTLAKMPGGEAVVEETRTGYALAGEEKTWLLDVELQELNGLLTLTADTNVGPIETVISLPEK